MSATGSSRSFLASPEVYKVIAENGDTRVIVATWKPGQRDEWHSHPTRTAAYALTDCDAMRIYLPSGQSIDGSFKAGHVEIQSAILSHSFENRSSKDCKMLFVEKDS